MANPMFTLPSIDDIVNVPCSILDCIQDFKGCSKTNLLFLHVNVRSLGKHWGLINVMFNECLYNYDVIVFTEINLKWECVDFYNWDGFNKYTYCRRDRRGGGVMMFVKNNLNSVQAELNLSEAETIYVKLKLPDRIIHVCGIYRPPDSNVANFTEELEIYLDNVPRQNAVVLLGDFNVDMRVENRDATRVNDVMASHGLYNVIRGITREEVRDGVLTLSCIDLIFVRGFENDCSSAIVRTRVSDHYLTLFSAGVGNKVEMPNTNHVTMNEAK